ncbi:MAG TPA: NADP-dependent isocitrate dehydrogenase [Patescibacteria group bacterium]|nr:NADP-dependent isocitrate dehydrogenase [Patescibacteria group bacterium]
MSTPQPHRVTVIPGDGVGPEVVRSAVRIIAAQGVRIDWEEAEAGAEVFKQGDTSGVPPATRESIERTGVVLKGPLETPVGFGEKSANVTLRKLFETYANVRPARELPGVPTRYAGEGVDMIVVRENVEDLYAGIEHMLTPDVGQCLKIISRKGSERVIRYAFELARREGRRKVTCATKANIMKLTEGLFKAVFEELSPEYPEIAAEHLIIDNVAHQFAKDPAQFDIVVTTNLNGDIISDLASGLVGGLGFASSGNYGDRVAIFEAVHGSAPKYAGKDVINPTALILSSVMMLRHLGELRAADRIENAVLRTLQQGQAMTQDLVRQTGGDVDTATSTTGFTDAVIANLGKRPEHLAPRRFASPAGAPPTALPSWSYGADRYARIDQRTVGLDIFIATEVAPDVLGPELEGLAGSAYRLEFIESRGTKVYPSVGLSTDPVGLLRARFVAVGGRDAVDAELLDLQARVAARHPGWTHVEKLHVFDGVEAFTRAQGQ